MPMSSPMPKNGVTLHLIVIDTVDLDSKSYDRMRDYWRWIEGELSSSKADFILVAGHYPVYAINYPHTRSLVSYLRPLLIKYGAHYASGHEHVMYHMKEPGIPPNTSLHTL